MKIYKVGGAVRDILMGVLPRDIDYVVTGSSVEEMKSKGFKMVGNDFPVFLHPSDGSEYALARIERKVGVGYNGFSFQTDGVSIEDDLGRRDLTINAIAIEDDGNDIYDPFNGFEDIQNRILRHINDEAFKEDPVRVLRIARFLARWPDFVVAKETVRLCREIVANGEMEHLTAERIWKEMEKALSEKHSSRFFVFLEMVGALQVVFPDIYNLIGKTQPYEHHPEGDAFVHTMLVLDNVANENPLVKFCALTHDLGKGTTPQHILPHHYGHEDRGSKMMDAFCERYKVPSKFREHAKIVAKYHTHIHNFMILNPKTIVEMFQNMKVKQNSDIMWILPMVSQADSKGRTSFYVNRPYPNALIANHVFTKLSEVKLSNFMSEDEIKMMSVPQIQDFMKKKMIQIVKEYR